MPSGCNLSRLAFHFSLDGYISIYIPIKSMRSTTLAFSDASRPAARSVKRCDWVSFSPVSKRTLPACACGALKPINICAPLPGRVETLEWKLLKQRSTSSRGSDCLVLRSGSRGRRRNITSHSAQGRAGQGA
jgi:hypothetical protein